MSFAGDCTLGRDDAMPYDVSFNNYYDKNGPGFFFQNVKSIFDASDLTVVDMEGTLTTQDTRADKQFAFRAPLEYVNVLKLGGVDAVTIANNHTYDYGPKSYEETVDTLRSNGITVFGNDLVEVVDVKGIKVGLVGVYALEGTLEDPEQIRTNITAAREAGAQIVVVFFHWGIEYTFEPNETQLTLGHNAVDWGADLVVGCHVHCIQTIEAYKGTNIVYALGNFSFGGNWYPRDIDAMIYQHSFTVDSSGKIVNTDYQVIPCLITSIPPQNNYQPTPATGDEKVRIQNKLQSLSPTLTIKFSE
ncbi:MAG: CapA family protein [Oscillospiraceae bacterium]|nr:CapA family protein [Oscillospiraceae bacterium]